MTHPYNQGAETEKVECARCRGGGCEYCSGKGWFMERPFPRGEAPEPSKGEEIRKRLEACVTPEIEAYYAGEVGGESPREDDEPFSRPPPYETRTMKVRFVERAPRTPPPFDDEEGASPAGVDVERLEGFHKDWCDITRAKNGLHAIPAHCDCGLAAIIAALHGPTQGGGGK